MKKFAPSSVLRDWKWFNLIGKPHRKNDEMLRPLGPKNKNDCHRGRNKIIAGKFHVLFFLVTCSAKCSWLYNSQQQRKLLSAFYAVRAFFHIPYQWGLKKFFFRSYEVHFGVFWDLLEDFLSFLGPFVFFRVFDL